MAKREGLDTAQTPTRPAEGEGLDTAAAATSTDGGEGLDTAAAATSTDGGAAAASTGGDGVVEIVEDFEGAVVWTVEQWGTLALWRCSVCGWDTLDGEGAMARHYLASHAPRAAAAEPVAVVYDRYGREVEQEV